MSIPLGIIAVVLGLYVLHLRAKVNELNYMTEAHLEESIYFSKKLCIAEEDRDGYKQAYEELKQ